MHGIGIGMDESSQLLPWMEMDPSKGHTHVHVVAREAMLALILRRQLHSILFISVINNSSSTILLI
jgi:hypothetical protein